jgi:hypothetical protein
MSKPDRDRDPADHLKRGERRGTPLIEQRAAYFALMDAGSGAGEAARRVGINYRTAERRRAAAAEAVAAPRELVEVSSRFLSLDERIRITDRSASPGCRCANAAEFGCPGGGRARGR